MQHAVLQDLGRQADSLQADMDKRARAADDRLLAAERQAATQPLVAITLCIVGACAVMVFDAIYLAGSGGRRILQLLARLFGH